MARSGGIIGDPLDRALWALSRRITAWRLAHEREIAYTIMRSTIWNLGPMRVARHRVPPQGVDPYTVEFNQHDPASYPCTSSWHLWWGRLSLEWRVQDKRE